MFTALLPAIEAQARYAFRKLRPEDKAEAIEEVIANAYVAFCRLVERGKAHVAKATPLAQYAVRQYRDGRRVGAKQCVNDVLSPCARRKRPSVQRLDRQKNGHWLEIVIPDDSRPVHEQAAFRIDYPEWIRSLPTRQRRIAEALALGDRTTDVARRFRLSSGRIAQMRSEFRLSWEEFNGEEEAGL